MSRKTVPWKSAVFVAAALAMFAGGLEPQIARADQIAGCDPGVQLDGSTLASAKKAIEAAGYQQVRDLKKGCDNFWHGKAMKDGNAVNVVLSPQGQVMTEGD